MTNANLSSWIDRTAFDPDGEEVGVIDDIYVDEATRQPEWLAIKTGRGGKGVSFVPLAGSGPRGDDVAIAHRKGLVDGAPGADPDGTLTFDEEARLYAHYGLEYSTSRSESGLPEQPTVAEVDTAYVEVEEVDAHTVPAAPRDAQAQSRRGFRHGPAPVQGCAHRGQAAEEGRTSLISGEAPLKVAGSEQQLHEDHVEPASVLAADLLLHPNQLESALPVYLDGRFVAAHDPGHHGVETVACGHPYQLPEDRRAYSLAPGVVVHVHRVLHGGGVGRAWPVGREGTEAEDGAVPHGHDGRVGTGMGGQPRVLGL